MTVAAGRLFMNTLKSQTRNAVVSEIRIVCVTVKIRVSLPLTVCVLHILILFSTVFMIEECYSKFKLQII